MTSIHPLKGGNYHLGTSAMVLPLLLQCPRLRQSHGAARTAFALQHCSPERGGSPKQVAYYGWSDGIWRRVKSLSELRSFLESTPPEDPPDTAQAMSMFEDTA